MAQTIYASPEDNLQAVFDTAEENTVIRLAAGDYRQKTVIRTPGLTLVGAGADKTRILWDDYAKKLTRRGWNTTPSAPIPWRCAPMG